MFAGTPGPPHSAALILTQDSHEVSGKTDAVFSRYNIVSEADIGTPFLGSTRAPSLKFRVHFLVAQECSNSDEPEQKEDARKPS